LVRVRIGETSSFGRLSMPNEIGSPSSAARWLWIYGEMLRIEQHRTDELQNQQTRIGTVLAVNGFLLAFLAATGILGPSPTSLARPYLWIYVASLVVLSGALILGTRALLPKMPIRGGEKEQPAGQPNGTSVVPGLFLDPKFFVHSAPELATESLLRRLCEGLEANMRDHAGTLARRRRFIYLQLYLISLAIFLLAVVLLRVAFR
jgi:hypothetical protein